MEAEDAELHVSAATVWEMAVKAGRGRLTLPASVDAYVAEKIAEGYRMMAVTWAHAAAVERLPFHHRDPVDRVLVAQGMAERMPIVTRDRIFRKYGVSVVW